MTSPKELSSTKDLAYSDRLKSHSTQWWKVLLDVQAPYRFNLRRLQLGFFLDVGCGIGRNLKNLNGHGVGVDHNAHSVEICRQIGFRAYTEDDFRALPNMHGKFDSLLFAHILEHVPLAEQAKLVESYLPYLKANGRLIFITPQERGYQSDPTHVHFVDFGCVEKLCAALGLKVEKQYSFPFPRWFGTFFKYNEFVVSAQLRAKTSV